MLGQFLGEPVVGLSLSRSHSLRNTSWVFSHWPQWIKKKSDMTTRSPGATSDPVQVVPM